MLRVRISINWTDIVDTNAVRIKGGCKPSDMNTYRLPDGTEFQHRYGDGALSLAKKILARTTNPPFAR
jgi:hypothetical protein